MACLSIGVTIGGIVLISLIAAYYKIKRWVLSRKASKAPISEKVSDSNPKVEEEK
jgi:hypothetical protein